MKELTSDSVLLENYINGCNKSLSKIYSKHYPLFMKVSKKYLCNIEEAEDLIHSVIERLLTLSIEKRKERFGSVRIVGSYFYIIIKNASLDYIKKKKLNYVNVDSYIVKISDDFGDENNIELEYQNSGLSPTEIIYFEEYLNGVKPRQLATKYSKSVSTIKNSIHASKVKIISKYKNTYHCLE